MPEAAVVRRLKRTLESEGALVIKYRPGNGQRAGVPDLYVAHPEWHGWIEAKSGRGRVTDIQRAVMEMLEARGVPVCVVHDDEIRDPRENLIARIDWDYPLVAQLPPAQEASRAGTRVE